jgi:alpha-1,3-glucan synthase
LKKSERTWYGQFRDAKLGRKSALGTPASSIYREKAESPLISVTALSQVQNTAYEPEMADLELEKAKTNDQWLLGKDYSPPTGAKWLFAYRIGDWPVYR